MHTRSTSQDGRTQPEVSQVVAHALRAEAGKWTKYLSVGLLAFATTTPSNQASANDLTAPFSLENARVLPKNVRNPRFIYLNLGMSERFNGAGQAMPLGAALNRQILASDLINSQPTEYDRALLAGMLEAEGIDGVMGSSRGEARASIRVMAPALAYGVTDRWTVALVAPVFRIDVDVRSGFDRSDAGERFLERLRTRNVVKAHEAATRLNTAANSKATSLGYRPIETQSIQAMGDVQLVNKVQLLQDSTQALALRPVITFPTGRRPDPDAALDIPTTDGRMRAGMSAIHDVRLAPGVRWSKQIGFTLLLPQEIERRIPVSVADPLSADKETLRHRLGNLFLVGTGLETTIPQLGLVFGAGYHFQYMSQNRFSGSNPDWTLRYQALEELLPAQSLHSFVLTAGFSSIEWYRSGRFVYPFEAHVALSQPVMGSNVPVATLLSGELVLFF